MAQQRTTPYNESHGAHPSKPSQGPHSAWRRGRCSCLADAQEPVGELLLRQHAVAVEVDDAEQLRHLGRKAPQTSGQLATDGSTELVYPLKCLQKRRAQSWPSVHLARVPTPHLHAHHRSPRGRRAPFPGLEDVREVVAIVHSDALQDGADHPRLDAGLLGDAKEYRRLDASSGDVDIARSIRRKPRKADSVASRFHLPLGNNGLQGEPQFDV